MLSELVLVHKNGEISIDPNSADAARKVAV